MDQAQPKEKRKNQHGLKIKVLIKDKIIRRQLKITKFFKKITQIKDEEFFKQISTSERKNSKIFFYKKNTKIADFFSLEKKENLSKTSKSLFQKINANEDTDVYLDINSIKSEELSNKS
jgi:hypothetical protein